MSIDSLALWSDIMKARKANPRGCGSAPASLAFFLETLPSFAPLPRIFVGMVVENEMEEIVTGLVEDVSSPARLERLGYSTTVDPDSFATLTALGREEGRPPAWFQRLQRAVGPKLIYLDAGALEEMARDVPGLHERYFGSVEAALAEARRENMSLRTELAGARLEIQRYENEFAELRGRAKRLGDAEAWRQMAELTQHQLTTKLAALLLMVNRHGRRSPSDWDPNIFQKMKATVLELRERVLLLEGRNVRTFEPRIVPYGQIQACVQGIVEEQVAAGVNINFGSRGGGGLVKVDLDGLQDCVEELVANARHWMVDERLPEIKLRVSVRVLPGGERTAEIVCEDNGQGVPDEHKHLIFLPIHTLRKGGKGLGLHMLKRFCEVHRGECYENGRPGSGARFVLRLPLEMEEEADAGSCD